ncbi:Aspartate carbamoyltransferase 2 [Spatholobus suberectus]|nr:Aspartate carbamoyltransferase 2 [Spatholobus suberectus]
MQENFHLLLKKRHLKVNSLEFLFKFAVNFFPKRRAAAIADIPIINAVDGPGQHPTQERFGERIDLYEKARGKYIVNQDILKVMPKHVVVMHPLPRLDEAKYGLYIRMALLKLLFVGW